MDAILEALVVAAILTPIACLIGSIIASLLGLDSKHPEE